VVYALEGLCSLAGTGADGARTLVDANLLSTVAELRLHDSPHELVLRGTVDMLQILATHDFALKRILKDNLCNQLVSILRRVSCMCSNCVLTGP
jgi:hypothetical protein